MSLIKKLLGEKSLKRLEENFKNPGKVQRSGWYGTNRIIVGWGLIGIALLFSQLWLLGIIFILGAWYVYNHTKRRV